MTNWHTCRKGQTMRLIDADALIADLDKGLWGKDYDKALAEAIIQDAPSIEITFCKECKYGGAEDCPMDEIDDEYFCNFGERQD